MELKDIEEERDERGKTPDRLDAGQQQRRGSHLMAAAGIGYENRRRHSQQTAEAQRVFQQGNEVYIQDKDGKTTILEVVEVREKMGLLRKAVPTLPIVFAIIFCLFNTLLPGTGTIMGAISLLCCGKCRHDKVSRGIKYGVIAALLQILTAVFIIGWIYSIVYGVNMVQDSMTKGGIKPDEKTEEENGDNAGSPGVGNNKNGAATDVEANKPSQTSQAWA